MHRLVAAVVAAFCLMGTAYAQLTSGPPGPYVIDVQGAMLGVPVAGEFYPSLAEATNVPGRGFGFNVGAHVFGPRLGPSRMAFGVGGIGVRGSVGPPDVSVRMTAIAPQVSFNFGSRDGWSYLSAGYGVGSISTHVTPSTSTGDGGDQSNAAGVSTGASSAVAPTATDVETGRVGVINLGGGARWFITSHLATGFDVRFYRFAASNVGTSATTKVALSVGVSLR